MSHIINDEEYEHNISQKMTMPNVREMSDADLNGAFMVERIGYHEERNELYRRLSALRAEVERLKAEAVVMRELCEASESIEYWTTDKEKVIKDPFDLPAMSIHGYENKKKWLNARAAYRAMKGEKDVD